jgi:energy-coupling factor transport system permease protein
VHPIIRIAIFFVAAAFLATGQYSVMLFIAIALLVILARAPAAAWRAPITLLRRLRWLLISMLAVYGWFTPGTALWPALGMAAPTLEGLSEGLLRATALLLIALAAQLLITSIARPQLLAALYWFAQPLRLLGLSRERLALRLVLTLDAVPRLADVLTPRLYEGLSGNVVTRFGQIAARAFQGALQNAEQQANSPVEIATTTRPPLHQWFYPVILIGLLATLS